MKIENKILPNEEQLKGFTDEPEKEIGRAHV